MRYSCKNNLRMKAYLILLLLFPFFCLAQEDKTKGAAKPSTTDCPTWKKKDKKASKAEYFQYLRTAKPQSKTPTNYTTNSDAKVQPNTVQQRTKRTEEKEEVKPVGEKILESTAIVASPKRDANSTSSISRENKITKREKEEKKQVEELPVKQKEEIAPVVAIVPDGKPKLLENIQESLDEPKSQTGEKVDAEKTKFKQKLTRLTRKTTKVRKHSNAKCPSF